MFDRMKKGAVLCFALCLGLCFGVPSARGGLVPKVDNFIFFVDQSGSMYMHNRSGELKMLRVKEILTRAGELIPELQYKVGICLFAPFQVALEPVPYEQEVFSKGIGRIKSNQPIFGRQTAMAQGLRSLGDMLAGLEGSTAVILFSDGDANQGAYPVPEAINLWADHPQTAVHVVSLAEDDLARETLRLISLAGKGKMVEASELLQSEPALEAFVQDVLLDILPEEPPEPSMHHVVTLLFESRSSRVGPAAAAALEGNAAALRVGQDPIIVDGHSDGAGSEEENQIVSEQRAEAVKSLLVEKGISVERVRCVAYGKLRPVASNETPDGRSKNRRVEIKVLRQ